MPVLPARLGVSGTLLYKIDHQEHTIDRRGFEDTRKIRYKLHVGLWGRHSEIKFRFRGHVPDRCARWRYQHLKAISFEKKSGYEVSCWF
jgi:hypothetical protein